MHQRSGADAWRCAAMGFQEGKHPLNVRADGAYIFNSFPQVLTPFSPEWGGHLFWRKW